MHGTFEKQYEELKTKYNLPQLEDLRKIFKFEFEKNGEPISLQIREEISATISDFSEKIIEPLISGESFSSMLEQKMLTDQELENMFMLYRKIQALKWENNMLTLCHNEEKAGECIKKMWDLWNKEIEKHLCEVCKKLSVSWSNIPNKTKEANYYG